jgi:hypothetical protein
LAFEPLEGKILLSGDDGLSDVGYPDSLGSSALAPAALQSSARPKSLVIMLDGARADALLNANLPNISRLVNGQFGGGAYRGAFAYAQTVQDAPTSSAYNHGAILAGVSNAKLGVTAYTTTALAAVDWDRYPTYLATLERANPGLNTAFLVGWSGDLSINSGADYVKESSDPASVDRAVNILRGTFSDTAGNNGTRWNAGTDPDAIGVFFLSTDGIGHVYGFSPDVSQYAAQIRWADSQIGRMLNAIEARPNFANEDWQIVITADHGGVVLSWGNNTWGEHGPSIPACETIPFLVVSKSVQQGYLAGRVYDYDTAPTVIEHMLGAAAVPSWYDGHAQGQNVVATSPATLADSLVAYLPFEGNYDDFSSRGNNASVGPNSDHVPTLHSTGGKFGGYVEIDNYGGGAAHSSYLTLGRPADLDFGSGTDYTLLAWYREPAAIAGTPVIVGNRDAGSSASRGTLLQTHVSDGYYTGYYTGLGVSVTGDAAPRKNLSALRMAANQWWFVATTVRRDGSAILYVGSPGGVLSAIGDYVDGLGNLNSTLPWNIGQDGTGNYAWNLAADLDDVAVWRRALSIDEIRRVYNNGAGAELASLINRAPVLAGAEDFTAITEDDATNSGNQVADLIAGHLTDDDPGAAQGIAVTGLNAGNGTWQFSLDNAATWADVGTVSDGAALLLRPTDRLRLLPDGRNSCIASLSFRGWDQTFNTAGQQGARVDVTKNGGMTSFSAVTATSTVMVYSVNDAPVLTGANDLTPIRKDEANNNGTLVSALVGGKISDVDTGAVSGIAVTAVDNAHGIWQYATNGGTPWTAFGSPTPTAARLLAADANTRVRFVPTAGWSGVASIAFRAWDRSVGTVGGTADVSAGGGASAFSAAAANAAITVSAVYPTIDVGNLRLLPNAANQVRQVRVTGTEYATGLTFRIRVGDGLTPVNAPRITDVSLLGTADVPTVFDGNNLGQIDPEGTFDHFPYAETRQISAAGGSVLANGVLALVSFDTTGVVSGSWNLVLADQNGVRTAFVGAAATIADGTVSIGANQVPQATGDSYTTYEHVGLNVGAPGLKGNDSDADGDALTVSVVVPPSHAEAGSFAWRPDGAFYYTPVLGWFGQDSFTYRVFDGQDWSNEATVSISVLPEAEVIGRYVFYNNSAWDGASAGIDARDDDAIAADKTALRPGQTAAFANYTSYRRGMNGVMLDVSNLAGVPGPATLWQYFEFKVGNFSDPSIWATAPAPNAVAVRPGAGQGGSDRVVLTWADGAIKNQWLQVKVLANAATGLLAPDIFYFGNAVGEAGNSPLNAMVDAADELAVRTHKTGFAPAAIIDPYDFDRDRRVNANDEIISRRNHTSVGSSLKLIDLTGSLGSSLTALAAVAAPQSEPAASTAVLVPPAVPDSQSAPDQDLAARATVLAEPALQESPGVAAWSPLWYWLYDYEQTMFTRSATRRSTFGLQPVDGVLITA